MKEIDGKSKNIRTLLGGAKFAVDYYQREYRWETKQITELLDDLTGKFQDSYEPGTPRSAVADYGRYFLGSILISDKDGHRYIIDGQQRLTSLTLLLIHLYRQLKDEDQKKELANLIFSYQFGARSFNLDVEERTACMDALFTGSAFDEEGQTESVVNILARYADIDENFPEELLGDALPYFADWLIQNVYLVEITAYSDADAYTIFETMNDRGLSLTPTDMLKGYLLANIGDSKQRTEASKLWRQRIESLQNLGKDEDADAIKTWLRSQHALTIRERERGAQPRDFDLIGTEFHRWVRDHEKALGLKGQAEFSRFVQQDFAFFSKWYERVRKAALALTPGMEAIHYNAQNNFTLQYPALLAPLVYTDSEETTLRKLRVVATYLDILIARRIWNNRSTDYSTMQYNIFKLVILPIRGMPLDELVGVLTALLDKETETFASNERFRLHGGNRRQIHRLLARMTAYVETGSGRSSRYAEYIRRQGKDGYDIEHIWADHPERHADEFAHPADFDEYRNHIGGLLLLPKSFNRSYGDMPYADKRPHYFGQNLLAQSLCDGAYKNDPGFARLRDESGLTFHTHADFRKDDMDQRQLLYRNIAERLWSPVRLIEAAQA